MPFTALQAALGEPSPILTFDMVERACSQRIRERSDLEWKAQLPLIAEDRESKQREQAELAKDLAAMANTGGGIIVYGVKEVGGGGPDSNAAGEVKSVGELPVLTLQQIHQAASNLV